MRLINLTWKKAEQLFEKDGIIVIAIGSIENHGTHLPLGTDTLIPNKILDLLEQKNDVLIAPTIPYGACDSMTDFAGTISIGYEGLYLIVNKIISNLIDHGIKKFVFLNGHGGNIAALNNVAIDINNKGGLAAVFNWWLIAPDINEAWRGGHGGAEETAGVMAVDPKLVDLKSLEDMNIKDVSEKIKGSGFSTVNFKGIDITMPRNFKNVTDNGWIGKDHPNNARKDWGEEMLDVVSTYLSDFINEFRTVDL